MWAPAAPLWCTEVTWPWSLLSGKRICSASKVVAQPNGMKLALNQFGVETSAEGGWTCKAGGREVLAGLGVVAVCEAGAVG